MDSALISKYNIPGPRYTSYPTVPYWDAASFSIDQWKESLVTRYWLSGREVSLYIHLPFCESLCTYCGCNTRITKNHKVESRYLQAVLREWQLYLSVLPSKPIIKELHLGGGTPTFFSPENLELLVNGILKEGVVPKYHEYAFEGHPNNTTREHLKTLYDLGFRRVSFGIQDFDPTVQQLINRIQPFENVKKVTEEAREIGYTSINFDLIYGLPGQRLGSIASTVAKVIQLVPDRIAFYSYAHIPKQKPAQKSFEHLLPNAEMKQAMYTLGKELLTVNGYYDIGMDHFAFKSDSLYQAHLDGSIHRNFMGYSTQKTDMVIGLGVSAIGDSWSSFAQNEKNVGRYYQVLDAGDFPIIKGHHLSQQDTLVRRKILDLICKYETSWTEEDLLKFGMEINFEMLDSLRDDGLVVVSDNGIKVTEKGRPFIRNICMVFDVRMWRSRNEEVAFSRTI